jgi:hypothetical protein
MGLLVLLIGCSPNDAPDTSPAQQAFQQTLAATTQPAPTHPRLFFGAADVPALRQRVTNQSALWAHITTFANNPANTHQPAIAPTNGDFDFYRSSGNQLLPIAFACVIENSASVCSRAKTLLLTYANWTQWSDNNTRGLGLAHMLMGNALAYDWLHSQLSEGERARVRTSLAQHTQEMYEATLVTRYRDAWRNWWTESYAQNHYWITSSALGMAALALQAEDARAMQWLSQARFKLSRVQALLEGIGDGSWHEGIPYQSYGLSMTLPFWVNLRRLTQTDDLPHRYLKAYGAWRLYNHLPNQGHRQRFVLAYGNFDWSWADGNAPQNILRFVAAEYKDAQAQWVAEQLSHNTDSDVYTAPWAVFGSLYHDASIAAQPPPANLPLAHTFYDLGAVIWRTGWSENDLAFGLKSGPYGGQFAFNSFVQHKSPWANCTGCNLNIGHARADANSFYLFKAGQWLAPQAVQYDGMSTEMGNTVLVNGQGQWRHSGEAFNLSDIGAITESGSIEITANTRDFSYASADAKSAYPADAQLLEFTRQVLFVRPGYIIMADALKANKPNTYEWTTHVGGPAENIQVDGNWVRGDAGEGQTLGINIVAPAQFAFRTGNHRDGDDKDWGYIAIRPQQPAQQANFVHVLYPTGPTNWANRPQVQVTEDNAAVTHVLLQHHIPISQTDDVLIQHTAQPRIAALSQREDGRVLFLSGNGTFALGGVDWVSDWQGGALQVRDSGDAVTVEAPTARPGQVLRLHSPAATRVILNGLPVTFTRNSDVIEIVTP